MAERAKTHVSEEKKSTVKNLAKLMGSRTILVTSVKNLSSSQFQDIRKKLRGKAEVKVAKKSLIDFALEHANNKLLEELVRYVQENSALLFSEDDAFELSAFLSDNKSSAKAKAGQVSPEEIKVEAGPTDLAPGPDISALGAVGLQVKIEGGKIAISKSAVLVKVGEEISSEKASILAKLNINPFKIGLEPIAAFFDGKVYSNVKVNKGEALEILKVSYSRALAFGVSLNYPNKNTLGFILGKAAAHEKALAGLIKPDSN